MRFGWSRSFVAASCLIACLGLGPAADAAEKGSEPVSRFMGSFSQSIPIEVPPFHGLEPRLALSYSSESRNGFVGVGWSLSGFSTIERVGPRQGAPMWGHFGESDRYALDGEPLHPCEPATAAASCQSGGNWYTKNESYLKILLDPSANTWTVWGRDGTRTVFSTIYNGYYGWQIWGQSQVTDTKGNAVSYTWSCDGECVPASAAYGSYRLTLHKEIRPDVITRGITQIQTTRLSHRLKTVWVGLASGSAIRAYKMGYQQSATTGRSLLDSVQVYGKDVALDSAGTVLSGISLPPQTFGYQHDARGKTLDPIPVAFPTGVPTLEAVSWRELADVHVTGTGNSLFKCSGTYSAGQTCTSYGPDTSTVAGTLAGGTAVSGQGHANAFDGVENYASIVSSSDAAVGQDFGTTPRALRRVRLRGTSSFGFHARLQYSDDSVGWVDTEVAVDIPPGTGIWTEADVADHGAHRYWRFKDLGGSAYLQINEIEMLECGGTDLTTVNGTLAGGTAFTGQGHANAFDNLSSFASIVSSNEAAVGQDFGTTARAIRRVRLNGTGSFGFHARLQYSNDNAAWVDTEVAVDIPPATSVWIQAEVADHGAHRYWRFKDLFGYGYLQINEIEMLEYGPPASPSCLSTETDLATVAGTLAGGTAYPGQGHANAFDNIESYASIVSPGDASVGQDFGATPRSLGRVRLRGTGGYGFHARLQYSDDTVAWVDTEVTVDIPPWTSAWTEANVADHGPHRYWRFKDLGGYAYLQINEIEMLGATNGGASSTRAIAYGDGYVEWTHEAVGIGAVGLSHGDPGRTLEEMDFAVQQTSDPSTVRILEDGVLRGTMLVAPGDALRIEVSEGVVLYKRNGQTQAMSARIVEYPLLVDTALTQDGTPVTDVRLSGVLIDVVANASYACAGQTSLGDFDGDGRTDQLCYTGTAGEAIRVALGTQYGLAPPQVWRPQAEIIPGYIGDFNGDGKSDFLGYDSYSGVPYVSISSGSSFAAPSIWDSSISGTRPDGYASACRTTEGPIYLATGDFDGNGMTDILCRNLVDSTTFVGLSTGSGFNHSVWDAWGCNTGLGERDGIADIDGDGRDDWYCADYQTGQVLVFRSTGSGFAWGYFTSTLGTPSDLVVGDLNGDGVTDFFNRSNGRVFLQAGHYFEDAGAFGAFCGAGSVFAVDVDGDGASELVCNNPGAAADDIQVRKWTGSALATAATWLGSWCAGTTLPGDFDGDGKTDLLCGDLPGIARPGTPRYRPDLLATVWNGMGGRTDVTYAVSTGFPGATNSPSPKYVVATLTTNDGRGGSSTTSFSYSGALMDRQERRFLGFRLVRETKPCLAGEAACPYTETWFRQDLASAGRPEKVERRDGQGHLLDFRLFDYSVQTTLPRKAQVTGEWSYSYDGSGASCSAWPCPNGKRTYTSHQYDDFGNLTQTTNHGDFDVSGDETTLTRSFQPNAATYIVDRPAAEAVYAGTNAAGLKLSETVYSYDAQGYATSVSRWLDSASAFVSRTTTYDGHGNPAVVTDETLRSVTTSYDPIYTTLPVSVENGAGERETIVWDPVCGIPSARTDANGLTTTTQTDALCRVTGTSTEPSLGTFELRSYPSLGDPGAQRVVIERPPASGGGSGNDWTAQYFDGFGRVYRTERRGPSSAGSIVADTSYNERGGVAAQTEPYYAGAAPRVTSYAYDAFDRPVRLTHPDGTFTSTSYGLLSQTSADENGRPATRLFDVFGRVVSEVRALGGQPVTTTSSYDLLGRLVGLTDDAGNQWAWTYDSLGRNVSKQDPDAGAWSFAYDSAGRLTRQTDAKGQETTFTHDAAGRLLTKTNGAGTVTLSYGEARSGYSNAGRLTTTTAPGSALKTDYDSLGRVVRLTRTLDGADYTVSRRYDAGGRLLGITYPDGDEVGSVANPLVYDAAGRLASIPGILTSVTYDASGRPLVQTNANGTVTTRSYSAERGFLTGIQTGSLQNLAYSYDAAGLVTQVTSPYPGEAWSYTYDDLYRLTESTNLSQPAETQSWSYDTIGRITSNFLVGTYSYGTTRPHAPVTAGVNSYSYDLNGNLTAGAGRALTWDADNRITQVTAGGATTAFSYDGFGERLKKTSGGTTSLYPFGDDYEITNGVVTKYVSVEGLGVIAKRVTSGGVTQTYWLHTDRLGSVNAITDASGAEVYRKSYRPYGETLSVSGNHAESRGWIDQRNDAETGLTYLHARYYDPAIGVFASPDPIGVEGGLNLYGYGLGNPVSGADRSGLLVDQCEGMGPDECYRFESDPMLSMGMGQFLSAVSGPGGGISSATLTAAASAWDANLAVDGHGGPYLIYDKNGQVVGITLDPVSANHDACSEDPASCRAGATLTNIYVSEATGVVLAVGTRDVRVLVADVRVALRAGAGPFGHIGIGVNQDERTDGFYSTDRARAAKGETVPGRMEQDKSAVYDSLVIKTTPEQDSIVQEMISRNYRNPPMYNRDTHNCAIDARGILAAAGIPVPPESRFPGVFFGELKKMHGARR